MKLVNLGAAVILTSLVAGCSQTPQGNSQPSENGSSSATASESVATPSATPEPQPAGSPPGAFETKVDDDIRYLTSLGGDADAVAHEVSPIVGPDGCLYFVTLDPETGAEVVSFGVLGNESIAVTSEGLMIDGATVLYGETFTASRVATPAVDTLPDEYVSQCRDAEDTWSVDT